MTTTPYRRLTPRVQRALDELKATISTAYPNTEFAVQPAIDDPGAFDLIATGDFPDLVTAIDLTGDRQMELLINDDIAIWLLPQIRRL